MHRCLAASSPAEAKRAGGWWVFVFRRQRSESATLVLWIAHRDIPLNL